jgi:beta-galactosidase/beta-glucuronidase
MKKLLLLLLLAVPGIKGNSQETITHYLSGTDKDHTVPWQFFCTKGRNSGAWTSIAVPSQWEQQGFGGYAYGWDKDKPDEQGLYKFNFDFSPGWRDKKVFIVFEGVMTDAEVKINGKPAGDIHQGGFYQFSYDITDLLQPSNLLEVTVSKQSSNASVEKAERGGDFWTFGGIYRPVYLKIVPATYIERVAIDAKADGIFNMLVFSQNTRSGQQVEAQVQDLAGRPVGAPFRVAVSDSVQLKNTFSSIKTWDPEQPALYQVKVSLKDGAKTLHTITQRFGFRTVEMKSQDGFYVNGVKIFFKGVNRHSAWPETGRTLSRSVHWTDITMMKDMNMNAVRMSHYPPDQEFLDLCDSLGLFVIDELTGWQAAYDTIAGRKLVKELVLRDVNHPSIIMWANGNEGGWNRALDGDYHWYDPQKRFVMHPWEKFNSTDTKHYPDFNYVTNSVLYGNEIFYPTEFMHGLYDGGHAAGLDDFWNEMQQHRFFAGGFLWSFHDEGIVRTDKNGEIDTHGNAGADGIVGPHREKEGSYFAIKEIWSPVAVLNKLAPVNGLVEVENRYLFTNLNKCRFAWELGRFALPASDSTSTTVLQRGTATVPSIAPGERGVLKLNLPPKTNADVLYLTAIDANDNEIFTWSWALHNPGDMLKNIPDISSFSTILETEDEQTLSLVVDGVNYIFEKSTGFLKKVISNRKDISLHGGPDLAGVKLILQSFKHYDEGRLHIVEPIYSEENRFTVKWIFASGQLPRLEYRYNVRSESDYLGITFNYPEENITGMKWLGRGPYHVWKNRLKGMSLGVWQKKYNNTITGESWDYPEFKGWHSELFWVKLQNKESDFTIYTDQPDIFLYMLKPERAKNAPNENTNPPFPSEGNIGFMHAISPIGTKFQPAEVMGPQSRKNVMLNAPMSGSLWFDFR